jgi:hypothetical protein
MINHSTFFKTIFLGLEVQIMFYGHLHFGKNEMGGRVARMGQRRCLFGILVGKPEEKKPLGRPRRRWEDNININLQEMR